ncbi:SDR family oxidoreductase [Gammaproteobacteria bacterium 42_54_T18]|nr:SDR family oxidoreductase [Gammaproteobacteria bacterium 42_54_T18]
MINNEQLEGKVALVTGASSGIGRTTALALAASGMHVFLACRSEAKAQSVLDEINNSSTGRIKAEFIPLDLGELDSVRRCAALFVGRNLPLHLLVANAGLAGQKGMTESGFELAFGTCHVGHFLLTQLLLTSLKQAAPSRIVVVSSQAHKQAKDIDFAAVRRPTTSSTGLKEYAIAKLANVLFASELSRRLEGTGITTYSLHPGVVASDVWRSVPWPLDRLIKFFMLNTDEGAQTTLYCATSSETENQSGLYYDDSKVALASNAGQDKVLAEKLWKESEQWVSLG